MVHPHAQPASNILIERLLQLAWVIVLVRSGVDLPCVVVTLSVVAACGFRFQHVLHLVGRLLRQLRAADGGALEPTAWQAGDDGQHAQRGQPNGVVALNAKR